jgi:hypothetical protein
MCILFVFSVIRKNPSNVNFCKKIKTVLPNKIRFMQTNNYLFIMLFFSKKKYIFRLSNYFAPIQTHTLLPVISIITKTHAIRVINYLN